MSWSAYGPCVEKEVDYYNLKLPGELVKKIDAYVERNPWGYRSRAEVVTEAVRSFLRRAESERPWRAAPKGERAR